MKKRMGAQPFFKLFMPRCLRGAGLQRAALCLPEKSYGHAILIVTLKKNGAFKKSLQKKIRIIKGHSVTFRLQYKTLL